MKLYNKGSNPLSHTLIEIKKAGENEIRKPVFYTLATGETKDIPDEVAKIWLNIAGVEKYADPAALAKAQEENAKLKEELKKTKKNTK